MYRVIKQPSFVLLFAPLLSSSGCIWPESSPPTIEFEGDFNQTSDEFVMEGRIIDSSITSDPRTYQDVTIEFYTEDGSLIRREPMGSFESVMNMSVKSERIPKYVILDSPDFYGGEVEVAYYTIRESGWSGRVVDTREELPIELEA